jgi:hypothetical protein
MKTTSLAGLAWATGFGGFSLAKLRASATSKFLWNLILEGGPDFRHLIVPPFDANKDSYGYAYWSNRYKSHAIGSSTADWETRWNEDYDHISLSGVEFGVLKIAGWLTLQIEAGNVAIVNNVFASENRDHAYSLLLLQSGDLTAGANDLSRNGWGGRLAEVLDTKLVSLTQQVRLFCNGVDARSALAHDNARVIAARDTRKLALSYPDALVADRNSTESTAIMARICWKDG